jgi:segregation and condensation protein A
MTSPALPGEPRRPSVAGGLASPYAVKLPVFEGPLDLLLHLIRLNEVEITDIPVALIAEQYLEYLELMRELDLDVAGEYLLMAATLAWIKSRMLLPPESDEETGEEIDPRTDLMARLLEYQRFKEAAGTLGERRLLGRDVFDAHGPRPESKPDAEREIEVGLLALLEALRRALKAAGPAGVAHEIEVEQVTVRERMVFVMRQFGSRDDVEFDEVTLAADGGPPTRPLIVATFLAILELTRLAALRLYQSANGDGVSQGPIHLRRVERGEIDWEQRIAEVM